MIAYVTRPENHEVIMGGWRSFTFWTDEPHFYHWPVKGWMPTREQDPRAVYYDRGWAYKGDRKSGCRVKPLFKQNPVLEQNAWELAIWSCIPKSAGVELGKACEWADTLLPGEDPNDEFRRTNVDSLLWHYNKDTERLSAVHHKRFLMEVNLISGEVKLLVPTVHFFDGNKTVKTQDIEEPYMSRTNYVCEEMDSSDDIPF